MVDLTKLNGSSCSVDLRIRDIAVSLLSSFNMVGLYSPFMKIAFPRGFLQCLLPLATRDPTHIKRRASAHTVVPLDTSTAITFICEFETSPEERNITLALLLSRPLHSESREGRLDSRISEKRASLVGLALVAQAI